MTVNCEAMVEAACDHQASESNQAMDDSSAKTIEFLRARLLAERASSKFARQQAQQISEKVKDLHDRLEREIELRMEAQSAMEKVFALLKVKGVALDIITLPAASDAQTQADVRASPVDAVEGMDETSDKAPSQSAANPVKEEDIQHEVTQKGVLDCLKGIASELHQMESAPDTHTNSDNAAVRKGGDAPLTDIAEEEHSNGHLQVAIKEVVHPGHETPGGTPVLKEEVETQKNIQHGLSITSKLKAMLQQIEEEVGALPEEQPLKGKLQGWVDHAANMLDRSQEADLTGCVEEEHSIGDCEQTHNNWPLEANAILEPQDITQTKEVVQSKLGDAISVNKFGLQPIKSMHHIAEIERSAPPGSSCGQFQQRFSTSHIPTDSIDHSLQNDLLSRRRSCSQASHGVAMSPYVSHHPLPRGPWSPRVSQYDNSCSRVGLPPLTPCGLVPTNNCIRPDTSYLVEVPSPKSLAGHNVAYAHGQHIESWSPIRLSAPIGSKDAGSLAKESALEGDNRWSPARSGRQPGAMLSNGCFVSDASKTELLMEFDRKYNHQKIHFEGEENSLPHNRLLHQASNARYNCRRGAQLHPKDLFPSYDAALSGLDGRNGRLGGILMALDAARQHIQHDELMGPSTPMRADPRLMRGYQYEQQPLSSEFQYDTWRSSAHSRHSPIIQFPPSPTSDHGYSPFEQPHGRVHRRSSSVSTNFMMSAWDDNAQLPAGEVELGNGITLYTD